MSRLDRFEDILKSYDGRNFEEVIGYKKNFCIVFDEFYLSQGMSSSIRANIREISRSLPPDKSYAWVHTEQELQSHARPSATILTPWIDDIDSYIRMSETEQALQRISCENTASALKQLAEDRKFSGMILTDWLIEPINAHATYQAVIELSKSENKFCVIYFHDRGGSGLEKPRIDLVSPLMFSSIDSYADRYHVTCVKDLYELMKEYTEYAILGKSKPTKYKKVWP